MLFWALLLANPHGSFLCPGADKGKQVSWLGLGKQWHMVLRSLPWAGQVVDRKQLGLDMKQKAANLMQ